MALPLATDDSGFMTEDETVLFVDVRLNDTLDDDPGAGNSLSFLQTGFNGALLGIAYFFPDAETVYDALVFQEAEGTDVWFGSVFSMDLMDQSLSFSFLESVYWLPAEWSGPVIFDPCHFLTDFVDVLIGGTVSGDVVFDSNLIAVNWEDTVTVEGELWELQAVFAPLVSVQAPEGVELTSEDVEVGITTDQEIRLQLGEAFQSLGDGETATIQLSYVLQGDLLTDRDEAGLSVTVQGINDIPIAENDSVAASHVAPTIVNVLQNDLEADANDVLTISQALLTQGMGSIMINADQTLTYDPEGRYNTLLEGDTASIVVSYQVSDGHGGVSEAQLTLSLSDINDAPEFAHPAGITLYDTVGWDYFLPVEGQLFATDLDDHDTLVFGLEGDGVRDNGDGTVSLDGRLGTLTVDKETGRYSFAADTLAVNESPQSGSESFALTVTDDQLVDSEVLQVNVEVAGAKVYGGNDTDYIRLDLDQFLPGGVLTRVNLRGGLDVVQVDSEGAWVALWLSPDEVGNGDARIAGLDGSLAVRSRAENVDSSSRGSELSMDDEGVIILSLDRDVRLFDRYSDMRIGDAYRAVGLGSADADVLVADEGFSLGSYLNGGQGDDNIGGGTGNDLLIGGVGNDTVDFTRSGMAVNASLESGQSIGDGSDRLVAFENIVGSASADVLTGNSENNMLWGGGGRDTLTGSGGHDVLDGGAGGDSLTGGAGNDSYYVEDALDRVSEISGQGLDTVISAISFTLGANIENLILQGQGDLSGGGNSMANMLTGNDGVNTLSGGAGQDSYYVDQTEDVIIELSGGGTDFVFSSASYALSGYVENLTLTGTGNISGTGNSVSNLLDGNSGDNWLDGQGGNDTLRGAGGVDTLVGGAGNDVYFVTDSSDVVIELASQGTDVVNTSVDYTLSAYIEQLVLTRSEGVRGVGNAQSNQISGNGNDNFLAGSAGADTLSGSMGSDTYFLARGDGSDVVDDSSGSDDMLLFGDSIAHDQLWFSRTGLDLEVKVIGTQDKMVVRNWYNGGTGAWTERIVAGDGMELLAGEVEALVTAMAGLKQPSLGQTSLNTAQHAALDTVIAANWS